MMKTIRHILAALAAITGLAALAACAQVITPQHHAGGATGQVILSVSTGADNAARTILPKKVPVFSRYVLEFSQGGTTITAADTSGINGAGVNQELDPGIWTATVSAYRRFKPTAGSEMEYLAARGSAPVTVTTGKVTPVTVDLKPVSLTDKGFFTYTVSFPGDATASLTLTDGVTTTTETPVSGTKASIELDPGYYDLVISLTKGTLTAGASEKVHIYSGLESEAAYTFTDADFAQTIPLAGTVNLGGGVTVASGTLLVYTPSNSLIGSAPVPAGGTAWAVGVSANHAGSILSFKLDVLGSNGKSYTATGTTGTAVTAAGVRGIPLIGNEVTPGEAKTLVVTGLPVAWTEVSVVLTDEYQENYPVGGYAAVSGGTATVTLKTLDENTLTLGGNWTGTGSWHIYLWDVNIFEAGAGEPVAVTQAPVAFSAAQTPLSYAGLEDLRGAQVGQISGSVTLTNVPVGAKVSIMARVYSNSDDDLRTSPYPVTLTTGAWTIPLYEGNFRNGPSTSVTGQREVGFRLEVVLADGSNYRIEGLAKNLDLTNKANIQAGNIGTKSLQSVTLSGTINVTYNDQPVPHVEISAYSATSGELGYVGLSSPGANAPWSLTMPAFDSPRDVTFTIYASDSNGHELFRQQNAATVANVHNTNKTGIFINLGDVQIITLSGTINVTHNGQQVPEVGISAYRTTGGNQLGYANLSSPGANAPWSLTMPAFASPTDVTISIYGWDGNQQLFNRSNVMTVSGVHNTNKTGIFIDLDVQTITLSGTINVTHNQQPVPRVTINATQAANVIYISGTQLTAPGAGASWSLAMPAFASPTDVTINIYGYDGNNQQLFSQSNVMTVSVHTANISGIAINPGNIQTVTLSGTINVTRNGQPVPQVGINAYRTTGGGGQLAYANLTSPGTNAPWSLTMPAFDSPTDVTISISGYDGNQSLFSQSNVTTVSVHTANISGIAINPGNISTITLSGTITVTNNGQPVPQVRISAYSTGGGSQLGYANLSSPGASAPWSLTIPAFASSTDVTISISGYDSTWNQQLFSQSNAATVTGVYTADRPGIAINLGDIQTITLSGTIKVTYNGQPVPRVTIGASSTSGGGSQLGFTQLTSPGASAPWSLVIPASSTTVYLNVYGNSASGSTLFYREPYTTLTVPVANQLSIVIDLGDLSS
jgi:hypothetical protein